MIILIKPRNYVFHSRWSILFDSSYEVRDLHTAIGLGTIFKVPRGTMKNCILKVRALDRAEVFALERLWKYDWSRNDRDSRCPRLSCCTIPLKKRNTRSKIAGVYYWSHHTRVHWHSVLMLSFSCRTRSRVQAVINRRLWSVRQASKQQATKKEASGGPRLLAIEFRAASERKLRCVGSLMLLRL